LKLLYFNQKKLKIREVINTDFQLFKYQIMVTFMLLSATSIGSVIATYLAYKGYYNQQKQLASLFQPEKAENP
jgi:patatin-like phospholipase/acyl hydrolase